MNFERQPGKVLGDVPEPGEEGVLSPQVGTECGVPDEVEPQIGIGHVTGSLDLAGGDPPPCGSSFGSDDHPIHATTVGH